MATTAKDVFKLGFLTRCAEEGLTGEALERRLGLVEKVAADPAGTAGNALLALYGVPIGLSLLGGGAAGYGAAKLTQPKISDDDIKAQELVNTYKVYTDRLRARQKAKAYRPTF